MDDIKTQLRDMGFNEAKIERALKSCPEAQTLEQVMEWLISHEHELNSENPPSGAQDDGEQAVNTDEKNDTTTVDNANQSRSETTKVKKLTVEETQKLMQERLAQRAEEVRKKAIEDEKKRRIDGQKMSEIRVDLQTQEMINMAEAIRREKLEKEFHKKRVLEQIARDRENMRQKSNPKPLAEKLAASASSTANKPSDPSTECKIALRFADGSNLIHKFSPKEQLSAVRLFVQMEKSTQNAVEFVVPPNKKLGQTNMHETLEDLGLCPASRLEVRYCLPLEDLD